MRDMGSLFLMAMSVPRPRRKAGFFQDKYFDVVLIEFIVCQITGNKNGTDD